MWYVYIIYSESTDKYYSGVTDDLDWRLERHNASWGRYTKRGIPWKIVYTEDYEKKADALKREREIKAGKVETILNHL